MMMHIIFPISTKLINFTLFEQNLQIFPIFVQLTFFDESTFVASPIFSMMHLCIMLYTNWTPMQVGEEHVTKDRQTNSHSNRGTCTKQTDKQSFEQRHRDRQTDSQTQRKPQGVRTVGGLSICS